MDDAAVRDVIKQINGPNAPVERHGKWINSTCPFAKWLHPKGTDRSPSFGIHSSGDDRSVFHCFTCKQRGTISMLWERLGEFDGNDYSDRIGDTESLELLGPTLPEWRDNNAGRKSERLGPPISEELTLVYDRAFDIKPSRRYLKKRGITRSTAEDIGLLYDPDDGSGQRRTLFTVRDLRGNLYGFTGRAIRNHVEPRVRDYYGLDKRLLLLGAEHCRRASGTSGRSMGSPIVLVEGLFDYAKVVQAGFTCVAALHSGLTKAQCRILRELDRPVVVMFDDDTAGEKGKDQVKKALGQFLRLFKIRYRAIEEPNEEGYTELDPGKLNEDEIRWLIKDRKLL